MVAVPAADTADARWLIFAGAATAAPGRTRTPMRARRMRRDMCRCDSVAASGRETPTVEPRGGVRIPGNRTPPSGHREFRRLVTAWAVRWPRGPVSAPRCAPDAGTDGGSVRASAGGWRHDAGALLVALGRQHACLAALSALILALG